MSKRKSQGYDINPSDVSDQLEDAARRYASNDTISGRISLRHDMEEAMFGDANAFKKQSPQAAELYSDATDRINRVVHSMPADSFGKEYNTAFGSRKLGVAAVCLKKISNFVYDYGKYVVLVSAVAATYAYHEYSKSRSETESAVNDFDQEFGVQPTAEYMASQGVEIAKYAANETKNYIAAAGAVVATGLVGRLLYGAIHNDTRSQGHRSLDKIREDCTQRAEKLSAANDRGESVGFVARSASTKSRKAQRGR